MNPAKFLSEHKKLAGNNALLKLAVLLLFVGLIVNAFIGYATSKRVRTIILPPVVTERIELSGVKFSESYLRAMTRYIIGLALTYTPSSARGNFDELLTLFDATTYAENKKSLYSLAGTIETAKVTSVFTPQSIELDENKHQITTRGLRTEFIAEQKTSQVPETYVIHYTNNNGRFAIARIAQTDIQKGAQKP